MANTDAPFGFRQYSGTGSAPTYEQIAVRIVYNATNIFFGDPVAPDANGYVVRASSNSVQIAGIFVGCQYLSVAQKRTVWSNYWPGSDVASGNVVIGYIVNDPNAKWVAQSDATGVATTDINANIGFAIGTGNTANGISGAYLDTSTINTTNTLPFRIISLIDFPPGAPGTNSSGQAYDWVVVAFNNVSTKQLTGI
jgi:hypothetical protein